METPDNNELVTGHRNSSVLAEDPSLILPNRGRLKIKNDDESEIPATKMGRPKKQDWAKLAGIKEISSEEIRKVISKYLRLDSDKLEKISRKAKNQEKLTTLEALIVSVISKAVESGDQSKFDFLLNRAGLRYTNEIEVKTNKDNEFMKHDKVNIVKVLQKYKKNNENLSIKFSREAAVPKGTQILVNT